MFCLSACCIFYHADLFICACVRMHVLACGQLLEPGSGGAIANGAAGVRNGGDLVRFVDALLQKGPKTERALLFVVGVLTAVGACNFLLYSVRAFLCVCV